MSAVAAGKAIAADLPSEAARTEHVAGADDLAAHPAGAGAGHVTGGALLTTYGAVRPDDDRAGRGVRTVINAIFAAVGIAELGLAAGQQTITTTRHVAGGSVVAREVARVVTRQVASAGEVRARRDARVITSAWNVAVRAAPADTLVAVANHRALGLVITASDAQTNDRDSVELVHGLTSSLGN